MKVKEIMTSTVVAANADDPINEVVKKIVDNRIHGIPIMENNQVVGIVTQTDFFTKGNVSLYLPTYIDILKNSRLHELSSSEKERIKFLLKSKASDVMTSPCLTINPEAEMAELLKLVKDKRLHCVPVVGKSGDLQGIVSLTDIVLRAFNF